MKRIIARVFFLSANMLVMAACAPTVKLKPLNLDVAAELPKEVALGWLEQTPKEAECCILPCEYAEEGVITYELEGHITTRRGKTNALRPWTDFVARPGTSMFSQYRVEVVFETPNLDACTGKVGLKSVDGEQICSAYVKTSDCKTVTKDVEKTLTALKALGVTVVPQKP